jgi:ABC-type branched-subunit amino acid transport system substrate-binding protein
MQRLIYLLILLWLLPACALFRKTVEVTIDQQAEQQVEQGKQLLKAKKYPEALDAFTLAADRNWHRATTTAIYLAGLSAYYTDYQDIARDRFTKLTNSYPKSRYVEDARYHLSLMQLHKSRPADQLQALNDLFVLAQQTSSDRLQSNTLDQIQAFLYDQPSFSSEQWENLYASTPEGFQPVMLAPWLYQQAQPNEEAALAAKARYDLHLEAGGEASPFLDKLFAKVEKEEAIPAFEPDIARIAMVMPFYWDNDAAIYNQRLPEGSNIGLEFYEGFKLGVESFADSISKKVFFRTYDSRHDTSAVRDILRSLDSLRPSLVVGDLFNSESQMIGDWAEINQIPQVVPLSASQELVEGHNYSFLAHPAAYTHGERLGEYAWYNLGLTRVSVFTDGESGTADLAAGFMTAFNDLGGRIDTMEIDPTYKLALKQIPDMVRRIVNDGTGVGVYIPLMGKEEAAGLIINLLRQRNKEVVVMGSPHFRSRYNTLNREIKERYQLLFTTSHLVDIQAESYRNFYNQYLKLYHLPPPENAIQGYDLARFLLKVLDSYDPSFGVTLDTYLRVAPEYGGLHIDYDFKSRQSNQDVNIGQYRIEGLIKVN